MILVDWVLWIMDQLIEWHCCWCTLAGPIVLAVLFSPDRASRRRGGGSSVHGHVYCSALQKERVKVATAAWWL